METARQFKNKVFMSCLKSSALCLPPSIRCLVCCQCLIPVLLPVGKRIFVSLPLVSKSEVFTLKPKQSKISCSPCNGVCLVAGRWECPWHDCTICSTPASSFCDFCPRSFCRDHEEGALTPSSLEDRLCCSSHNPASPLGSNSSSTQPHCSTSSPIRVKEELEPETETAQTAAEWLRSTAQYLIPCEVRYCWPPGHLWSEAVCYGREYSALWSVLWPPHKEETHWRTPQCRLWHDQRVDRRRVPAPSALFLVFFFFFFRHETLPVQLSGARLVEPQTHSVVFFCHFFQSRQCCHPHILALWRNSKVRSRKRRQVEEARPKLSTTEPLHSLFTCCKMSLAHRRALSPPLQPVFTPNIMVSQHPITQFLLLGEGERAEWLNLCNFCFPWDHTTFQRSYICF